MNLKMAEQPQYTVKKGDRVRITAQGAVREGMVSTASWYKGYGYDIELMDDRVGITYWKQGSDGGTLQLVEKGPDLPTLAGILRVARDRELTVDAMYMAAERDLPEMKWVIQRGFHDNLCSCLSWDVIVAGFPTVTVYVYTVWSDGANRESDLILVGEEAMQMMDWFYGGGAA